MTLRTDRVADEIRDKLALIFTSGAVSDPRLEAITITAVKVTPDLQLASIYYRVFDNSEEQKEQAMKGFKSCQAFLRKKLGESLDLRRVPELRFFFDDSIERAEKMEKLLGEIDEETS